MGSLLVLPALLLACGDGIPDFTPEELADATAKVREAYRIHDYEVGAELGQKWSVWAPEAEELKAWTVANLAKARRVGAAALLADELSTAHPDSPWAAFAIASSGVWSHGSKHEDQASEASAAAALGLPNLVEAHLLRWEALYSESRDSATAYFDALPEQLRSDPELRASQARTLWPMTIEPPDSVVDRLLAEYEKILQDHPDHLQTNLDGALVFSTFAEDPGRAAGSVRQAAAMTPSPSVHGRFWGEVYADPSLSDAEKEEQVSTDVRDVLATAGESPARLAAMAYWLSGMPDLKAELEDQVLAEDPNGPAAETILRNRFQELTRQLWGEPPSDPEAEAATKSSLAGMLDEFLDRREHHDPEYLFDAIWARFVLAKDDPSVDIGALKEMADELATQMEIHAGRDPSITYAVAVMALAEHPEGWEAARRMVELGKADLKARHTKSNDAADSREADAEASEAPSEDAPGEGEPTGSDEEGDEEPGPMAAYAEAQRKAQKAVLSAAMAKILMAEGRLDEAEKELENARDLDSDHFASSGVLPFSYLQSGQLELHRARKAMDTGAAEEAEKSLAAAEEYFLEGIRLTYYPDPSQGLPWVNPNEVGLEELYALRAGGLDGFDAYLAAAKDEGWEERQDEVLAGRLEEPKPMPAFALETLDGEEVTSESLLGRVLVINFWGTW